MFNLNYDKNGTIHRARRLNLQDEIFSFGEIIQDDAFMIQIEGRRQALR